MHSSMEYRVRVFVVGSSLTLAMLLSVEAPAQTGPADPVTGAATPVSEVVPVEQVLHPALNPQPAPSFVHLFTDTVRDARRIPSFGSLTVLGIGGAAAIAGHTQDASVTRRLSESSGLTGAFRPGRTIGGASVQFAGAAATYTLGRFTGSSKTAWLGADLLRAQMVTQTLTGLMKISVRRTRPDGGEFSFPSGHASVSFASATVLQSHFGLKAGIPAYAVASYVAASRIQQKRHYLSDVTFGAALGIVVGRSATIGRGTARFAVAPVAVPSGGAIAFTWVGQQ
jgi:membrane-associated phospholipid phosphatase